jgi:hypothetical protein
MSLKEAASVHTYPALMFAAITSLAARSGTGRVLRSMHGRRVHLD